MVSSIVSASSIVISSSNSTTIFSSSTGAGYGAGAGSEQSLSPQTTEPDEPTLKSGTPFPFAASAN